MSVSPSVQTLGDGDERLRKESEGSPTNAALRREWANFLGGKRLCSPCLFH